MVFQDPYSSLNPRQRIGGALEEPLVVNTDLSGAERKKIVLDMLKRVGLSEGDALKYLSFNFRSIFSLMSTDVSAMF